MPLTASHDLKEFCCGVPALDDVLKRRAQVNQISGASRTYVVAKGEKNDRLLLPGCGRYCAPRCAWCRPAQHVRTGADGNFGTFGDGSIMARKGSGVALLQDAVRRTVEAAAIVGIRGLLVHAISLEAKAFYEHHGFRASPTRPMILILSLRGTT